MRILRNLAYFAVGTFLAAAFMLGTTHVRADHTYRHAIAETVHKMHEPGRSCSAVMIAPELALTAGHCMVMDAPVLTINGVDYHIPEGYLNPDTDLAVIIVPGAPCPCASFRAEPTKEGEAVAVVGFPYGTGRVVTYGEVQEHVMIDGREYVLTTASAAPGTSGGGVFDESGYLVGILVMGSPSGTMTLYVEVLAVPFLPKL